MDQETRKKIFSAIQAEINVDPQTIDPDQDIRKNAVLDSMQFIALLARLEIALDVELPVSLLEAATLNQFLKGIDDVLGAAGKKTG
jgi:acyl carrier protein